MDKQSAEELKRYIDTLADDSKSIVEHTIVHLLLQRLESAHKKIHREEKGCAFEKI